MPYLSPETIPTTETLCRRLVIPADIDIIIAVSGAIEQLCFVENWETHGAITAEEIAAAMRVMFDDFLNSDHACP